MNIIVIPVAPAGYFMATPASLRMSDEDAAAANSGTLSEDKVQPCLSMINRSVHDLMMAWPMGSA